MWGFFSEGIFSCVKSMDNGTQIWDNRDKPQVKKGVCKRMQCFPEQLLFFLQYSPV